MGSGIADGENRALNAIKQALNSPLLNNNDIKGARNILLNITCGEPEITIDEISQITEYLQDATNNNSDIIFGVGKNLNMGEKISVTIIATGFGTDAIIPEPPKKETIVLQPEKEKTKEIVILDTTQTKINFSDTQQQLEEEKKEYNLLNEQDIEELENTPAINRNKRNIRLNTDKLSNEVSNISITSNQNYILKENNSFLHDNVD
jgi:cell division protein FtsZ